MHLPLKKEAARPPGVNSLQLPDAKLGDNWHWARIGHEAGAMPH
jgi:hypothetical protein